MKTKPNEKAKAIAMNDLRRFESAIAVYIRSLLDNPLTEDSQDESAAGEELDFLPGGSLEHRENYWAEDYWDAVEKENPPFFEDDDWTSGESARGDLLRAVARIDSSLLWLFKNFLPGFAPPPTRIGPPPNIKHAGVPAAAGTLAGSLARIRPEHYPRPDPIVRSLDRLRILLTRGFGKGLKAMADLLGEKDCRLLFRSHPHEFLTLLDLSVSFNAFADELIGVSREVLGLPLVRKVVAKRRAHFQLELIGYLHPLIELPFLDRFLGHWGDGLIAQYRRAVERDITTGQPDEFNTLTRRIRHLDEFAGSQTGKLIDYLGRDFCIAALADDPPIGVVNELIGLGIPIWEDVLKEGIGISTFKKMAGNNRDRDNLQGILKGVFRVQESSSVIKILGLKKVRSLIRKDLGNTRLLSAVGLLIAMRPLRFDAAHLVESLNPSVLELLAWAASSPAATATIEKIGREIPPGKGGEPQAKVWIKAARSLFRAIRLLRDAGCQPRKALLVPLIQDPQCAKSMVKAYGRIRRKFSDLRSLDTGDIPPCQGVLKEMATADLIAQAAQASVDIPFDPDEYAGTVRQVFDRLKRGERIEPIPQHFRAFTIEVAEVSASPEPRSSGKTLRLRLEPGRGLIDLVRGLFGCYFSYSNVARLFHPRQVFYRIYTDDSALPRGWLSVVEIQRDHDKGLVIEVVDPYTSLRIDPDELLRKLIGSFAALAAPAGFAWVGLPSPWFQRTAPAPIENAARERFGDCPLIDGASAAFLDQWPQSLTGKIRAVWRNEKAKKLRSN